MSLNHAGRHSNDGGIGGDILEHNRIGADLHIVANRDPAENLGSGPDDHMIAKRGVALPTFLPRPSKRHALEEGHVISDLCRLADDHTHPMIDEEAGTDLGRGMDFNAREHTSYLRNSPRNKRHVVGLQPMGHAVGQQGMKAGIGQHDFKPAGRSRISVEHGLEVLFDGL